VALFSKILHERVDTTSGLVLAITTKRGEMTKRSDQHGARAAVTK
jgi:hypothetical protein